MAINLKIIVISVVIGALVIGGAGYFYIAKIQKKEAPKESITTVKGGLTGKVEVLGRTGSEERKISPPLAELQKKIEQIRLRGAIAPEPEAPKLLQPGDSPVFTAEKPLAEKGKSSGVEVWPGPAEVSIPGRAILSPPEYATEEEYKKTLEKQYSDNYIASLKTLQDSLAADGFLKETERVGFQNQDEIISFWRKYYKFLILKSDISPEEKENLLKAEIDLSDIEAGTAGFKGEGSFLPLASSLAESAFQQLKFASLPSMAEEQLVSFLYQGSYLNRLKQVQEEMISAGFIKPAERVSLKTRKEVEWLMLKENDYSASKGFISEDDKNALKNAITNTLPAVQRGIVNDVDKGIQMRNSLRAGINNFSAGLVELKNIGIAGTDKRGFAVDSKDSYGFLGHFKDLLAIFLDIFGPETARAQLVFYTPNLNLENYIPGDECYNDLLYEAFPYGPDDWRACLWWVNIVDWAEWAPGTRPSNREAGPYTIPPGLCVLTPGVIFPIQCCSCLRTEIVPRPPFIEVVPWGCQVACGIQNMLWDPSTRICGCSP